MKLFTVGPVEMYPETLAVAAKPLPYFRTPEFSEIMLENERMLRGTVGAPETAKTVFLTASGTAAMEAAVMNCFDGRDKLLVINGGGFGDRFREICAVHGIPHEELRLPFPEAFTEEKLRAFRGRGYTGLLVNLHETATGQLYDIDAIARFCREEGLYLIVDAISAYGADALDFAAHGIDGLIVSSQKALALAPGLSVVVLSERLYRERVLCIQAPTLYFDFRQHVENLERGQTPFTPAVGILLTLHERLRSMGETGMECLLRNTAALARRFREAARDRGFRLPAYPLSNALTPLLLEPDAKEIYRTLKEAYGLVVTPSGGALEHALLRVGHLGNVEWKDYEALLLAMGEIRERICG